MKSFLPLLAFLFISLPELSHGYYSLMNSGDLIEENKKSILIETQYISSQPVRGANINGRFATGLNSESELQGEIGFGSVDFNLGGFWKWVPFPDTSSQPAVGARIGATFAKLNNVSTYGLQITPTVSKKISLGGMGIMAPYLGLPVGLQNTNDDTFLSLQGAFGLQYQHFNFQSLSLLIEYSFEIDDALNHFSLALSFDI